MTKQGRILELLQDGPGLTCEIAAEIGERPNSMAAHLSLLLKAKKIEREQFDIKDGCVRYLWKLPQ